MENLATIDPPAYSDGDISKRPDHSEKHVDGQHLWLKKLGAVLEDKANADKALSRWPDGYALYQKKRPSGKVWDFYLWGHPSGYRYRSAAEFAPHLHWLATDATHDRANCKCNLCRTHSRSSSTADVGGAVPATPRKRNRKRTLSVDAQMAKDVSDAGLTTRTRTLRARPSPEKKTRMEAPAGGSANPPRKAPKRGQARKTVEGGQGEDKLAEDEANEPEIEATVKVDGEPKVEGEEDRASEANDGEERASNEADEDESHDAPVDADIFIASITTTTITTTATAGHQVSLEGEPSVANHAGDVMDVDAQIEETLRAETAALEAIAQTEDDARIAFAAQMREADLRMGTESEVNPALDEQTLADLRAEPMAEGETDPGFAALMREADSRVETESEVNPALDEQIFADLRAEAMAEGETEPGVDTALGNLDQEIPRQEDEGEAARANANGVQRIAEESQRVEVAQNGVVV